MLADPDLLQRECLLVFLTGNLKANAVAVKRAKMYERAANFISKRERKREREKKGASGGDERENGGYGELEGKQIRADHSIVLF